MADEKPVSPAVEGLRKAMKEMTDINAPVIVRVPHQDYPKMLYAEDGGRPVVAASKQEEEKLLKRGFKATLDPSMTHDGDGVFYRPKGTKGT